MLTSATFLATTSQKFFTSFCSFWQCCRAYFPTTSPLPCPAPITRQWKLWSCNHYLAPAVTSLVSCPFTELYESCLCRGNTFYLSTFLCKELLPGLVDTFQVITGAEVEPYHKSLQWFNLKLSTDSGVVAKEQSAGVMSSYAFYVSRTVLLPLPLKSDTVSQPVKAWNIGNAMH